MKGINIIKRFSALESQRKTLDGVLQDIERYIVPFRGEFYSTLTSEHEVDWDRKNIYDNTACVAVNLLASPIHGNLRAPYNKWFVFRFRDENMNKDSAAMEWLEDAEDKAWQTLAESNFGTAAAELMEITSGELEVKLPGSDAWVNIQGGESFDVPANSKFQVKVSSITDYCCSYL